MLAILSGAAAAAGAGVWWCGPRRSDVVPVAVLLGALAIGLLWGGHRARAIVEGPLAESAGRQAEYVLVLDESMSCRGSVCSAAAHVVSEPAGQKVWLELYGSEDVSLDETPLGGLPAGTTLRVAGSVREPRSSSSGFNQAAYLRSRGIGWVIGAESAEATVLGRASGLTTWFAGLRDRLCHLLAAGVPQMHGSLMQGILLGIKDGIPAEVSDRFRRSGLSHMLTVSGSHIAWIIAGLLVLTRVLGMPRWLGLVVAALSLIVFVPLTDGGPSVLRAALTGGLVIGARLSGRGRDPWHLLCLAVLCLLASNPFTVLSPGMQLSCSAVIGILLLAPRLERVLHRLPPSLAQIAAVTLAASLGTAPVSMAHFGQVPLGSLPANLLALPVMPIVTALCVISCITGLVWEGAAVFCNQPAAVLVEWCARVAGWCAHLPVVPRSAVGFILSGGAGLTAAWIVVRVRRRQGGTSIPAPSILRRQRVLLVAAAVVGACLYVPGSWAVEQARSAWVGLTWPAQGDVHILDVGQGSAALVRTPGRQAILVDAGPAGQELDGQLLALGVRRLDLVIVSHPHEDHYGGLADLVGRVHVGALWDGYSGWEGAGVGEGSSLLDAEQRRYVHLRQVLIERGTVYRHLEDDVAGRVGECDLQVDVPQGPLSWVGDINETSLVVRVVMGSLAILLPGDAEAAQLEGEVWSPVDVLVVGHHGSRGSVSDVLLAELSPSLAVISVGANNWFGHPHAETLALLDAAGTPCVRTDRVGGVKLGLTPAGHVVVAVEREEETVAGRGK